MSQFLAGDYTPAERQLALSTYLSLARILGDFTDQLVVIGGLVPSLLVPQAALDQDRRHIGTADVDVVLHLGLLDDEAYKSIAELMRASGFKPDTKPDTGARVPQRWVAPGTGGRAVVEFLLPPPDGDSSKKRVKNLEGDFAAFLLPGGELAFRDARQVELTGRDLRGAKVTRAMNVCGPASFLVLKARAHVRRDKPKDAYDIHYLVQGLPGGHEEIVQAFRTLGPSPLVEEGLRTLAQAFESLDASGPVDVATFLGEPEDEDLRQDASGHVLSLLDALEVAGLYAP
ncbi:MAG: hypothetical protein H6741_02280 [Alphaproteobacteria bacterium]|nr:hypothetical protein [Alphaproteobacteria bacterium]MCB9791531.1 hypothetical protein [Alphaproteobacteria bacterium]